MTERARTIAVLGSTPFAAFLAGVIAADHSRAVVWMRDTGTPSLLPRSIDVSVAPMTRPETWRVLLGQMPEARRHLDRFEAPVVRRTDVVMRAHRPAARNALAHIAQTAASYDCMVDPLSVHAEEARLTVHDALTLDTAAFWQAAPDWLARRGVALLPWETEITLANAGAARLGDRAVDRLIVADSRALKRLDMGISLKAAGAFRPWTSVACEPLSPLPAPVGAHLETGTWWHQDPSGAASILAPGASGTEHDAIAASLPAGQAVRMAGRARFERFGTKDGAPLVGVLRGSNAFALEALGPTGFFMAPMLARLVCDAASGMEKDWAAARHPARAFKRHAMAEWHAAAFSGQAA